MQLQYVKVLLKRGLIFLLVCIVVGYTIDFFDKRNPDIQSAKEFIYQSHEIAAKSGKIENVTLWRVTKLKGGSEMIKGHSDYQFGVKGSLGNFVVVIRAEDSQEGERNVLSVNSIKKR
jgi:hypothetical protein